MDCNKSDCIHYKVCEEWKSLGNDNYINESNGNCDCYSAPYIPSGDCISREALKKHKFTTQIANGVAIEEIEVVPLCEIDNAQAVEPAFKPVAEIKVTLTEEEKQKFVEEFQKQRLVCVLPETQMEIVAGNCPIDANGDCPLRRKGGAE